MAKKMAVNKNKNKKRLDVGFCSVLSLHKKTCLGYWDISRQYNVSDKFDKY